MGIERRREFKFVATRGEAQSLTSRFVALGAAWVPFPPRTVNSLYFDDVRKQSLQESEEGLSTRAKIRLRWYGAQRDLNDSLVWLEWKAREGADVLKARIETSQLSVKNLATDFATNPSFVLSPVEVAASFAAQGVEAPRSAIAALLQRGALLPQTHIQYERAYFLAASTGLRVTVDDRLQCRLPFGPDRMSVAGRTFLGRTKEGLEGFIPLRGDAPVVVELKGPPGSEAEMAAFSQGLGLRRSRFSKYCEAMARLGLLALVSALAGPLFGPLFFSLSTALAETNQGEGFTSEQRQHRTACPPSVPDVFADARALDAAPGLKMKARQAAMAYLASARDACFPELSLTQNNVSGSVSEKVPEKVSETPAVSLGAHGFLEAARAVRRVFPEGDRMGSSLFSGVFRKGVPEELALSFAQERFGCGVDGCLATAFVSLHSDLPEAYAHAFEKVLLERRALHRRKQRLPSLPAALRRALLGRTWKRVHAARLCGAFSALALGPNRRHSDLSEADVETRAGFIALAARSCLLANEPAAESEPKAKALVSVLQKALVKPGKESSVEKSVVGLVPTDGQPRVENAFKSLDALHTRAQESSFYRSLALAHVRGVLPGAGSLAPEAFIEDVDALVFAPRWNTAMEAICRAGGASPTLIAFGALAEGAFPLGKLSPQGRAAGTDLAGLVRRLRDDSAALASHDVRYLGLKEAIHNALGPQVGKLAADASAPRDARSRALLTSIKASLQRLFPTAPSSSSSSSNQALNAGFATSLSTPAATVDATRRALRQFLALSADANAARTKACARRVVSTAPWRAVAQTSYWKIEERRFQSLQRLTSTLALWDARSYPDDALLAEVTLAVEAFGTAGKGLEGVLVAQAAFTAMLQKGVRETLFASTETLAQVALEVSAPGAALDSAALLKALPSFFVWHEQVLRSTNVQTLVSFLEGALSRRETAGVDGPLGEGQSKDSSWRAMNPGRARGVLRFVGSSDLARHVYSPSEILLTDALPLDLGHTAGIVTEIPQPRLSHIDLRTRERGTPNAYVSDARERWKALIGKRVEMSVTAKGVTMVAVDAVANRQSLELNSELKSGAISPLSLPQRVFQPMSPPFDFIPRAFIQAIDLDSVPGATTMARVGSKAFGYANLRRTFGPDAIAPKAYALPSSAYVAFTRASGLDELIGLTLRERKRLSPTELEARLGLIRATFDKASRLGLLEREPWFPGFVSALWRLKTETLREPTLAYDWNTETACFRFRSSSNAEDLLGITGAGLYESYTGCLKPPRNGPDRNANVTRAMARAWASLWGLKAFQERELRGIPHEKVAMALLVHRNFPQAELQGVAITPSRRAGVMLVSAAPGEASVTNPDGSFEGDEFAVAFANGCPQGVSVQTCPLAFLERRLRSSSALLSEGESGRLLGVAMRITEGLRSSFPSASQEDIRFDIEFKYLAPTPGNSERRLVVKQARPFLASETRESASSKPQ
jgi:hypothetical protein